MVLLLLLIVRDNGTCIERPCVFSHSPFSQESYICLPFIHARCSIVIIIYTDKAGGDLAVFPNGRGATNAFVLSVRVFLYLLLITVIGMGCLFSSVFALFIGWFLFVLC